MSKLDNEINDQLPIRLSGTVFSMGDEGLDIRAVVLIGGKSLPAWSARLRFSAVVGEGNFHRDYRATAIPTQQIHNDYPGLLAIVVKGAILSKWNQVDRLASRMLSMAPVGPICIGFGLSVGSNGALMA